MDRDGTYLPCMSHYFTCKVGTNQQTDDMHAMCMLVSCIHTCTHTVDMCTHYHSTIVQLDDKVCYTAYALTIAGLNAFLWISNQMQKFCPAKAYIRL